MIKISLHSLLIGTDYKSVPSGFGITLDELVHMTEQMPNEVTIVDKSISERINLIQQLEEEDKQALFRIIDSMLTKSKFKDFFSKNMASL